MTIRKQVKVPPGGVIEIADPALRPGQTADVTVEVTSPPPETKCSGDLRPLLEDIAKISASVPDEEWDRLPKDLSRNLRHYLYGWPKEEG